MNRKEFIEKVGIGAALVITTSCFGGCSKNDYAPSEPVDFTIDLDDPANNALTNNGGYIIKNKVVVARDESGNYVAATQQCSHEGTKAIILKNNEWFCTDHSARFDILGNGLNDNGSKDLTIYQTSLTANILRVFS